MVKRQCVGIATPIIRLLLSTIDVLVNDRKLIVDIDEFYPYNKLFYGFTSIIAYENPCLMRMRPMRAYLVLLRTLSNLENEKCPKY